MASVRKKGNKWQAIWREGDTLRDGKRVQRTKNFDNKQDARDHARRMEETVESQRVGDTKDQTVFQYLDSWCDALLDGVDPVDQTTQENYRDKVNILRRELPDVKLRRLQRAEIKAAYARLLKQGGRRNKERAPQALSPLTIVHVHRTLHSALEEARKNKLIPLNPSDDIDMPSIRSVRKKVRPFSIEEVCRLLDLAREPTIRQKFRNADRKPNNRVILDALRDGGKTAGEIKAIFAADSRKPKSVSPLLVAMKNNGEIIQRDGAYHLGNVTLLSKGQPQEPEVDLIASALLGTGVRRGELCGFADDNIDLDAGIVETTRNVVLIRNKVVVQDIPEDDGSRRKIALPPYVVERLREQRKRLLERAMAWGPDYQRKPLYYFPAPGGGPCDPSQVTERMDRLIARAGIAKIDERGRKVSPVHSWRHTSGSSLWSAYKDVKQVQARLGHATSEITMDTYVHADEAVDRTAAAHFEKLLRR